MIINTINNIFEKQFKKLLNQVEDTKDFKNDKEAIDFLKSYIKSQMVDSETVICSYDLYFTNKLSNYNKNKLEKSLGVTWGTLTKEKFDLREILKQHIPDNFVYKSAYWHLVNDQDKDMNNCDITYYLDGLFSLSFINKDGNKYITKESIMLNVDFIIGHERTHLYVKEINKKDHYGELFKKKYVQNLLKEVKYTEYYKTHMCFLDLLDHVLRDVNELHADRGGLINVVKNLYQRKYMRKNIS